MVYGSSDMKCNGQNFLSFWTMFCSFTPYQPKRSKFLKNEKTTKNIIILQIWTINDNHMMYDS